jgi:hypothetical protein
MAGSADTGRALSPRCRRAVGGGTVVGSAGASRSARLCFWSNLCVYWEAGDWGTLADRLGRYIPWEFAYKYDAFIDNTASERPPFPPREEP